jgi:hypothetical protein
MPHQKFRLPVDDDGNPPFGTLIETDWIKNVDWIDDWTIYFDASQHQLRIPYHLLEAGKSYWFYAEITNDCGKIRTSLSPRLRVINE